MEKVQTNAKPENILANSSAEPKTLFGMVVSWYRKQKEYVRGMLAGMTAGAILGLYIATFLTFWDVMVVIAGGVLAGFLVKVFKRFFE